MAKKQRKYDMEYKIQAVKLAKELGGAKAAAELGIPEKHHVCMDKSCQEGTVGCRCRFPHTADSHEPCRRTGAAP